MLRAYFSAIDPVTTLRFMLTAIDPADRETTERLELHALERMAAVLCEYVEQLTQAVRSRGSRETDLQIAVFAERREAARRALAPGPQREPAEMRIARLQKLVEALDCSRAFFRRIE